MKNTNIIKKWHILNLKGIKNYDYNKETYTIGIVSLKNQTLNAAQFKMLNFFLRKKVKKVGTIWLKCFVLFNNTTKATGMRMGKGKGNIDTKLAYIKKNEIVFLINKKKNISNYIFFSILKRLAYKIPKNFKIVNKKI